MIDATASLYDLLHVLLDLMRLPKMKKTIGTGMRAMEMKPKILVPQGMPTLWYKGEMISGNLKQDQPPGIDIGIFSKRCLRSGKTRP